MLVLVFATGLVWLPAGCGGSLNVAAVTHPQTIPSIVWAAPAAIDYGVALSATQQDATASVPGSFAYSPASGAVLHAGVQTLSATFTPNDTLDYTTAAASVILDITQAQPAIAWTPAGTFAAGMALGSDQLNATASAQGGAVPGTFVYSPAAGTIVTASGAQTLTVTFTPTDQTDYATVEASATLTVLPFGVVAWGDSLTIGGQGIIDPGTYPDELAQLITLPVVNDAVNANSPTTLGIRQGGVPTYATVSGGVIPASGSVTVTFPVGWAPVTNRGPVSGVAGSFLGVHGVVTYDGSTSLCLFTRSTSGSAVNAPGSLPFVVDNPYEAWIPVLWEGRNDIEAVSHNLSMIADQVAAVPPGQTYLILGEINGNSLDEWIGGTTYAYIVALNDQLASTYGSRYLDIRKVLMSNYDPAMATDVADIGHDEVPTSLRAVIGTGVLVNAIGPTDTTFAVKDTKGIMGYGAILTIDTGANAENVYIAAVNGNLVTVDRNRGGNVAAHPAGAPLTESDYFHLSAKGYQIVADAVAKYLSAYAR